MERVRAWLGRCTGCFQTFRESSRTAVIRDFQRIQNTIMTQEKINVGIIRLDAARKEADPQIVLFDRVARGLEYLNGLAIFPVREGFGRLGLVHPRKARVSFP